MRSLIGYLGCGNIQRKGDAKVNFVVQKFSDVTEKIIPFFIKYPLIGEKSLNFADFSQGAELMKTKTHLTLEGLHKIRKLKSVMNRDRGGLSC